MEHNLGVFSCHFKHFLIQKDLLNCNNFRVTGVQFCKEIPLYFVSNNACKYDFKMQPSKNIVQNSCLHLRSKSVENTCDGFDVLVKLQDVDLQLYSKRASPPAFSPVAEKLQCQIVFYRIPNL